MFALSFRNLFRQTRRTLIIMASIILGVASIILAGGFVEDTFVQLREQTIHSQLGHLHIYAQGYSAHGRTDPFEYLIEQPERIAKFVSTWPEISEVMQRINFSGLANNGQSDYPIIGEGVEPGKEARLGSYLRIVEGRQLADDDRNGILLGQGVARALRLKPGDFVNLLTNIPGGALNSLEFKIIGVFQSFSKEYDDRAVRIPLVSAQEMLATDGVHAVVFSLKSTDQTDDVVARLTSRLSAREFEVKPWHELADFYRKTVDLYRAQFGILQLVILLMVLLSVANSVNMAIYERTGEFGTLMALGNKRGEVFQLVAVEYLFLGCIGAAIGLLVGMLLAISISFIGIPMPPPPNSELGYTAYIRIIPDVLLTAFLVGVASTIFAALIPAYRASRLPIADALRANI